MNELEPKDRRHLDAAEGWLGLGNWSEASVELDSITPQMGTHPEVLRVRYAVYAAAKKWELAAEMGRALIEQVPASPFGFIHLAYALHELKRTREAWNVLLPVADKFPDEYTIRYNLACYAAQLGDLKAARAWLEKAIELAGTAQVKRMALEDRDLEPLRKEIRNM
jgi:predicted Zn-dependent protease